MLEVFLLDFDGDLYGREIEVEFIGFIRGDRRFDGIEALKAQMARTATARDRRRPAPGLREETRRRGREPPMRPPGR